MVSEIEKRNNSLVPSNSSEAMVSTEISDSVRRIVECENDIQSRMLSWQSIARSSNIGESQVNITNQCIEIQGIWNFKLNDEKEKSMIGFVDKNLIPKKEVWSKFIEFVWNLQDDQQNIFINDVMKMNEEVYCASSSWSTMWGGYALSNKGNKVKIISVNECESHATRLIVLPEPSEGISE